MACGGLDMNGCEPGAKEQGGMFMKASGTPFRAAEYWEKAEGGFVICGLCPHHCRLKEGHAGICKVRGVKDGAMVSYGYGLISSAHIDPVEKKPLYHYYPGFPVYSIGGWGCNFGCVFCQNWTISQRMEFHGVVHTPGEVVRKVMESGCRLIAYTYNEPLVGFEFVRDCCRLAKDSGLKNIVVTNGYLERGPAEELLPMVGALNVDIKSMSGDFYKRQCGGDLGPVLDFCVLARELGCHVEVTNLVIPGLNDSDLLFEQLADWVNRSLGEATPLHLSAYHPDYKAEYPATSSSTLLRAASICMKTLRYVYTGNVVAGFSDTPCPGCGATLIAREGYRVRATGVSGGCCAACGRKAEVVGLGEGGD